MPLVVVDHCHCLPPGSSAADMGGRTRRPRPPPPRLPAAAGLCVPLPLLADGLLPVIHGVFDAQHQNGAPLAVRSTLQRIRQIEFEGCIATFVRTQMDAIAPAVSEKI